MQIDLIPKIEPSRRDAARARGDIGIALVADKAERTAPGWIDMAVERLRTLARNTYPGMFSIEQARLVLEQDMPRPHDLRAWGKVVRIAQAAEFIERVPGRFTPAASSNSSPKPMWRGGAKA